MGTLVIACGTYDGTVFALNYSHESVKAPRLKLLKPIFVDPTAHNGSVVSLAIKEDVVLSGSMDEIIQIYSLKDCTCLGSLEMHVGTIRQLTFSNDPVGSQYHHLFSASDDGSIGIWRRQYSDKIKSAHPAKWECIRQLRRHKGAVKSIVIHPSNRCAFSISEDKTFRLWNLLRGRQAYAMRLKNLADGAQSLSISFSGRRLLFNWADRFDVVELNYESTEASDDKYETSCLGSVKFSEPMSALPVVFSEDDFLNDKHTDTHFMHVLVGVGGFINLIRFSTKLRESSKMEEPEVISELRLPGKRVKFIKVVPWPDHLIQTESAYAGRSRLVTIVTNDSDGSYIRGYSINLNFNDKLIPNDNFIPIFAYDVQSVRVTALSVDWCFNENNSSSQLANSDSGS